ncbi:unnamed protein product [Closterium sp. Naga37s-1]|nr:unnamed protein product [Closterium sp. Naga37s-1]
MARIDDARQRGVFGAALLIGALVFRWALDTHGCHVAQLLAIDDTDEYHAKLLAIDDTDEGDADGMGDAGAGDGTGVKEERGQHCTLLCWSIHLTPNPHLLHSSLPTNQPPLPHLKPNPPTLTAAPFLFSTRRNPRFLPSRPPSLRSPSLPPLFFPHALVKYYSRLGMRAVRVVEGGSLGDVPHMLVWGGAGTLMEGEILPLLTRWSRVFPPAAARGDF